ncbi:alginate O-acetyltransferase complex protein AlgI [Mucilaginibacter sp. UYP25]|uniref:MBOAT family O-acyltransferase n=1 Tax=unclassified Mucilaginibacter TaxID=2617802 RepID=UPI0033915E8A
MLGFFHVKADIQLLQIIQPIGISFFTFQTLGYNIDVYKRKIKPEKDIVAFLNFTSFFPQIFAGPIERGDHLIPQFLTGRKFNYQLATDGVRQITYGLFKKMVIADRLAPKVNFAFMNYNALSSLELLLGAMYFYIQIYCDFSGYSDIAIGTGKLLGFNLSTNFKTPFFAKTSREAWSRWNITLTAWFRDYVYMPLLYKNRKSTIWRIFCTLLLLVLIGLWHGANFTFITFGFLNGLYFVPHILSKKNPALKKLFKKLKNSRFWSAISIAFVFVVASVTTVFFRSPDIPSALGYLNRMFQFEFILPTMVLLKVLPLLTLFFIWEWFQQENEYQFDIHHYSPWFKVPLYYILLFMILITGLFIDPSFIYFNF